MVPAVRSTDTSSHIFRRRVRLLRKPAAWNCKTAVGVFSIATSRSGDGPWELWIGGERLGLYDTAGAAADAVEGHVTGCRAWDKVRDRDTNAKTWRWKVGPLPNRRFETASNPGAA